MKISIVSNNTRNLDELRRFVEVDKSREVQIVTGGVEVLGPVADQQRPDMIIFETGGNLQGEMGFITQLNLRHPAITLILLSQDQSADTLLDAMRAGIREVLPSPVSRIALQTSIARIEEKLAQQVSPLQSGKVLSFIPCKGGSGSTFLATNLAYILASEENKNVLMIDLNLQFGDASLFISDQTPAVNLAEVSRQIRRMDASFLAAALIPILPNFGLLAAPEDPVQALEVKPEHVDALLNLARNHYDYVILDIGRALDPVSIRALDKSDVIFPVMQLTLPFIRDAKRLLEVFRSLEYPRDKIRLLVNRYEKGGEIRLEDVEHTLNTQVFKTLPNSFKSVAASVNQGIPISKLAHGNPVAKGLQELAQLLTHQGETDGSWWTGLLKRK
ncbi:MAG: AAA family ATPase [Rhodocyclaceae bacterium]|nr:AAA family ATPase [Rhodocyclaceae bacterium]